MPSDPQKGGQIRRKGVRSRMRKKGGNSDGVVNFSDVLLLIQHYGSTGLTAGGPSYTTTAATPAIPEPSGAAILLARW